MSNPNFFTNTANRQAEKAATRVLLGCQLIAPSLRQGRRKDGTAIEGFYTMWATSVHGDSAEGVEVQDGAKVRLKMWADSLRISVPEGVECESFDQALQGKLFYAEVVGNIEPVIFQATDKRDGSVTEHYQIKVQSMRLMDKATFDSVYAEGEEEQDDTESETTF